MPTVPSRRQFTLQALSLAGGAVALAACGTTVGVGETGDTAKSDTGGGETAGTTAATGTWATGGTASMSGDYADPFTDTVSTCSLICEMTEGPCYTEAPARQDISEGVDGLPTRLALRILDTDCKPVSGAVVEVWHAAPSGLYSGEDTNSMCTDGDAEALASLWFRGSQTTDADGRVDFDTCFPGWYSGRAVHIHFRVLRSGSSYAVAQLFFPQSRIEEIYASHPVYSPRGQPDTPNTSDKVLGDNDATPYTLNSAQQSDGALLAWQTLTVRASLSEDTCSAPESSGGP